MPSVKNPNMPSRNRMAARASHQRKQQQKRSASGRASRIAKADATRGARPGLLPTSGPRAPLSAKKQKKVLQRMTLALKRKIEAEEAKGGSASRVIEEASAVEMTDAPITTETSS